MYQRLRRADLQWCYWRSCQKIGDSVDFLIVVLKQSRDLKVGYRVCSLEFLRRLKLILLVFTRSVPGLQSAAIRNRPAYRTVDMSSKDDRRPKEEEEEVGDIDPRRGPIPTEAPEDEGIDTQGLEADRKESDETENKGR